MAGPATDPGGGDPRSASRGAAVKLGAECAGRAFTVLTVLLVARGLGVSGFGAFAVLSGVAVLVAAGADLGLQAAASRELVARSFPLRAFVRAKLGLSTAALGASALGALLVTVFSHRLPGGLRPAVAAALLPLVLHHVLAGWVELLGVALRARGRPVAEASAIVLLRAGSLAGAWMGLASGLGLAGVAAGLALSPLPALVLAGLLLGAAAGPFARERSAVACLRNALPLGVNGALALASLRVEVLALAALRASHEAGLFAAGLRVVEFLLLVPAALCAGAMPALTREGMGRGSGARARIALTVVLVATPAAAGLWVVAPGLVSLLFGPEFAAAGGLMRILALALPALFLNSLLLHALMAAGRGRALPRLTGVRTAAAVALAAALVPALGTAGAALGFVASEWLLTALAVRACRAAAFPVPVARPLLVSAAATAPMAWVLWERALAPVPAAALGAGLYAFTLAAGALLGRTLRAAPSRRNDVPEPAASEGHVGVS